jgi:hypothetical protein
MRIPLPIQRVTTTIISLTFRTNLTAFPSRKYSLL